VTYSESAKAAAELLSGAGFSPDEARRDASLLARNALGWSMTDWAARNREPAPPDLADRLRALARRRASREPIAYITGVREFFGRQFRVTPAVLIPRPETEILVEAVLSVVRAEEPSALDPRTGPVILDVGTGSGCVAVTLALECPSARITASDVSAAALFVAAGNADALGASRVGFLEASLVPERLLPRPTIIVSNPPYVPESDRPSLAADVRDFEPASALFAGPDGLDVIRQLVPAARKALVPGGWLVMEIGAGQAPAVSAAVTRAGLALERIIPDLQGIPRVVVAREPAAAS
jgi:release factor glutamine methyltransferase